MPYWIDTHCHLDADEFAPDRTEVRLHARHVGVRLCVLPAVHAANFQAVRELAHTFDDAYALGIHPLYTPQASAADLALLQAELERQLHDPRMVAVGEIGLDGFVPGLDMGLQQEFYLAQLRMAQRLELPVILHVRRSADLLLKGLRQYPVRGGIAHAFNGSLQQAQAFIAMGFKLGYGGALTFDRALQLQRLARELPLSALVLETDAPDIPPHWLYATAADREAGRAQGRNEPAELPRIAQAMARLRDMPLAELAQASSANARAALPRLGALWPDLHD